LCRLTALAGGDEQCQNVVVDFEQLANEHKDSVYRQLFRVWGNREDAEDVLIDALLKAYQHMNQLNDPAAFRAWLAQIARRVCWQLKKREALAPLLQLSMLEEEGTAIKDPKPPIDSEVALRRMKELLENAVTQLPPSAQEVFVLRDMEELPGEEVSRRLGISLASMKSRLHRARKLLREHVDAALNGNAEEAQAQS
jgi:RNA polymerase sigma-70 factor (ECF subfamily)